ncbi:RNA 2',3'-cyclic phosphodiesterase [Candidatus Anstonella stagnisolia]|nr:RNA 2',3'-cyclic phosphodiesterase [Candidatus Anstonella stagnisolia]
MRLFCAIELPQEIKEKLAAAQSELVQPGIKLVEKENLHITLSFFGEVGEKDVKKLQAALSAVEFHPLEISMRGVGAFPNLKFPNVVFANAGCAQLAQLVQGINSAVEKSKVPVQKEEKEFHAHVTLARVKGGANISGFAQKYSAFDFGPFIAKKFVLKKSALSTAGSKYETIKQ